MKKDKEIIVGLIGNPNTGKTSLLNCLTGATYHVGNWPGKTVEKSEGELVFKSQRIKIVDLPGLYSIAPFSEEEKIARNFIRSEESDLIVQIIDVNTLLRNLFLTLELLALGKKLILAFNFNEEAEKNKIRINTKRIEKILQIPIVKIEANSGKNKDKLIDKIIQVAKERYFAPKYIRKFLKSSKEINHKKARKFLFQKIGPLIRAGEEKAGFKIDRILLNRYTAFPIFLLSIAMVIFSTFKVTTPIVDGIDSFFYIFSEQIRLFNLPDIAVSFITDVLAGGLGIILAFTPIIFIFYILIYLFEDTGYLSRVIVLIDRVFEMIGISGRAFIPLILGFGCNVPAVLATRTIRNKKEKLISMFLVPFIPCSAYIPLNLFLVRTFFPEKGYLMIIILYSLNIIIAMGLSVLFSSLIFKTEDSVLMLELPPFRMPLLKNVLRRSWSQTSLFVKKAGSTIFISVLVVWLLAILPFGVEYGSSDSMLGKIGHLLAPIFEPLGFGFWQFTVSLIFGLIAKEIFLGAFGVIFKSTNEGLQTALSEFISPLQAFSFLIFANLYAPCIATCSAIKKESGSWKFLTLRIMTSLLIAWFSSFVFYNLLALIS